MIRVFYKCGCLPEEVALEVPARPEGADILVWMEVVTATISMDHGARSPACRAEALEYAKIPAPESAPGIGMKPSVQ